MSKHSQRRRRGAEESTDEILRGKVREYKKEIDRLKSRIRQLEKQLLMTHTDDESDQEDHKSSKEPKSKCRNPKCNSDRHEVVKISKRDGSHTVLLVCNECGNRVKV